MADGLSSPEPMTTCESRTMLSAQFQDKAPHRSSWHLGELAAEAVGWTLRSGSSKCSRGLGLVSLQVTKPEGRGR